MAHYNRFPLLFNTLQSIFVKHKARNIEVIVVDDGSTKLEGKDKIFEHPITYIQLPQNKWYKNPVIPYNVGIEYSESDIVMIQNPECYHFDNIISHSKNFVNENNYLSYSCYSLPKDKTFENYKTRSNFIEKTSSRNGAEGWYNHSLFRPAGYHFCCSLHRKSLEKIKNFSRDYAWGNWFDDDDFVLKIKKENMEYKIVDDLTVLHQNHYSEINSYDHVDWDLVNKNKLIYEGKINGG